MLKKDIDEFLEELSDQELARLLLRVAQLKSAEVNLLEIKVSLLERKIALLERRNE